MKGVCPLARQDVEVLKEDGRGKLQSLPTRHLELQKGREHIPDSTVLKAVSSGLTNNALQYHPGAGSGRPKASGSKMDAASLPYCSLNN